MVLYMRVAQGDSNATLDGNTLTASYGYPSMHFILGIHNKYTAQNI